MVEFDSRVSGNLIAAPEFATSFIEMTFKTRIRKAYDRIIRRFYSMRVQKNSLLRCCRNTYSQMGDDGIIEHILARLKIGKGFFVEFGGWDGVHLSNTRNLFEKGWDGIFIEADKEKFRKLQENYKDHPNVICINEFVTHDPADKRGKTFDEIADRYFPDRAINLLSIDVDGMDYRIFESIQKRADVVIVEGGGVWHPKFNKEIPDSLSCRNYHQPLAVMFRLGKQKGYAPVCFNLNSYFISQKDFDKFGPLRNDAVSLWKDYWFQLGLYSRASLVKRRKNKDVRDMEGARFSVISSEQFFLDFILAD